MEQGPGILIFLINPLGKLHQGLRSVNGRVCGYVQIECIASAVSRSIPLAKDASRLAVLDAGRGGNALLAIVSVKQVT